MAVGPTYQITIAPSALKQLGSLPQKIGTRIADKIQSLAADPRPHGVEKLAGWDDRYRVRVGSFRVIYSIEDRRLLVLVLRIGDRKDVYRGP